MVVSRSCGKKPGRLSSVTESSAASFASAGYGERSVVIGGTREEKLLVMIVRTRRGMLSCLVRRMEAEEPVRADRRARERRARGTCKLMAFFAEADWIV